MSSTLFNTLLYAWIGLAIITFFVLLKITAPYGRHASSGWGPMISERPGWVIMELPVLLVLYWIILSATPRPDFVSSIMIGLFTVHYVHRTFVYPLRIRTRGKRMPLVIVASGVVFNLINGFFLGYFFAYFADYETTWFTGVPFIGGLIVFGTGIYINWKADNILMHLRRPGETHYILPRGWLFEKVSCPNLLGELIEWLGFAILCWNLPALAFFIWTAANLIPRAISHHQWYRVKFKNYPEDRYAILPYVL